MINNYNKKDNRLWCRNCGRPAYPEPFGNRHLTCANNCILNQDYGFMNAEERREWLASKVVELVEALGL